MAFSNPVGIHALISCSSCPPTSTETDWLLNLFQDWISLLRAIQHQVLSSETETTEKCYCQFFYFLSGKEASLRIMWRNKLWWPFLSTNAMLLFGRSIRLLGKLKYLSSLVLVRKKTHKDSQKLFCLSVVNNKCWTMSQDLLWWYRGVRIVRMKIIDNLGTCK